MILLLSFLLFGSAAASYSDFQLSSFTSGNQGFQVLGTLASAFYGDGATGIGDYNGDGVEDFVVSSAHSRSAAGTVIVMFGRSGIAPFPTIRIGNFTTSASTGFSILGASGDNLGFGAAGLGDLNGDGTDEMIVSAYKGDPLGRTDAGNLYVLYGRRTGIADISLASFTASATNGYKICGERAGDYLSLWGLGDYNNDGHIDIYAWAQQASTTFGNVTTTKCGTGYVIFGTGARSTDIDLLSLTAGSAGFRVYGTIANGGQSSGLTGIGDFNNDGYGDIAYSSQLDTYGGKTLAGAIYIYFGHDGATNAYANIKVSDFVSGTAGFKIGGFAANYKLGAAVGNAGDFNGDGLNDLVVATVSHGNAFIMFGKRGIASYPEIDLWTYQNAPNNRGQWLIPSFTGSGSLSAIGGIGDFNHDGYSDLVLAARTYDSSKGYVCVLFGHTNTSTNTYGTLYYDTFPTGVQGFKVFASAYGDTLGSAFGGGDVNGDGATDLLIGAPQAQPYGNVNAGAVYVIYGPTTRPTSQPSRQPSSQPSRRPSAQPSDQPSSRPSNQPSSHPSRQPVARPSGQPSSQPSAHPSRQPASRPSSQPSSQPSKRPTSQPSVRPSTQPSAQPSFQPSSQPSHQPSVSALQSILASPTYKIKNGFSFAAIGADGSVRAWGETQHGGDSSAVQSQLQTGVVKVVPSRFTYAAVKADGSVVPWGVNTTAAGLARYGALTVSVAGLIATEGAFAGVDTVAGRVIAFGSKHHGGDVLDDAYCNDYSAQLSAGVRSLTASSAAFAAIKTDGSVLVWGSEHAGAAVSGAFLTGLKGAKLVVATSAAFAALLSDNRVVSWGERWLGGDSSAVSDRLHEVHHIVASQACFVAFRKDSGVVVWGHPRYGGDTTAVVAALTSHVVHVAHTRTAFAALKEDGSVVAWGAAADDGDASAAQGQLQGITALYGNGRAFAAVTTTGRVVAWGSAADGGEIPADKASALSSNVVSVHSTDRAFAALKSDGSLVVWGQAGHGGEPGSAVEALLTSGVHTICSNDVAFSAIKTDGKVVAWGHSVSVPTAGVQFTSNSLAAVAQCA